MPGRDQTHLICNPDGVVLWPVLVPQELLHLVEGPIGSTLAKLGQRQALPVDLGSYYTYILQINWSRSSKPGDLETTRRMDHWVIQTIPCPVYPISGRSAIPNGVDTGLQKSPLPRGGNDVISRTPPKWETGAWCNTEPPQSDRP